MSTSSNEKRLIEVDFPLEQVSLDSGHEKNVRHGHVSTLHIWPARRPLSASRAALIATLLPDPEEGAERKAIYRKLAGEVIETIEEKKVGGRKTERRKRETRGGILHWGQENSPDLEWFREKIRKAYGRAPRVLDPFAGGGAIPLEAMRLGCDVTAMDISPVAWFLLRCTLEYPQKLSGKTHPLPEFASSDREFMESFLKCKGFKGASLKRQLARLGFGKSGEASEPELIQTDCAMEADFAWHLRAWGRKVIAGVRKTLARHYPTYAEFQPLHSGKEHDEPRPMRLIEPNRDGEIDGNAINIEFRKPYLDDPRNPRWVLKPAVAYFWARSVRCKGCRATIPLLKTRWLAKKENKRVLLTMTPNASRTGVDFAIENDPPLVGGNAAQRREHDKKLGAGTMSRSGAQCPCCPTIMTSEDIRLEGCSKGLGQILTAVVVSGPDGKEYRRPTEHELEVAAVSDDDLDVVFAKIPFSLPIEPIPLGGSRAGGGSPFTTPTFGIKLWKNLFTNRQLLGLGSLVSEIRASTTEIRRASPNEDWAEALLAYLALLLDKTADYSSAICTWHNSGEKIGHTFARFALPIVWDIAELALINDVGGGWLAHLEWVARYAEHGLKAADAGTVTAINRSAIAMNGEQYDIIVTDPPYYDAIPYSDLMDFFYVWLRRSTHGLSPAIDAAFRNPLGPKWDHDAGDGELIDDASRFGGDKERSKKNYEDGMAKAFHSCNQALRSEGRLVVVFANKQPDAWETLVAALIRSGFVVDASWPIQTEMGTRTRAMASAALASSVWLVCRKRTVTRPGWDTAVIAEMRERIHTQLRTFWDAGIRGPDFVWAATGPALEAFSKYPVVKKADEPNAQMSVSEFLREVRRLVVDFVVGRVLTRGEATEMAASLDDVSTYYLLHRNDFGLDDAPIGACILYALSCNLSDADLADRFDILSRSGGTLFDDLEDTEDRDTEEDDGEDTDAEGGSGGKGNKVKLKPWNHRKAKWLGHEGQGGRPVPLIDQVHRLMHLWRAGEEAKVDDYLETRGLKRNALFAQLLQALIELSPVGSEERSIQESLSNHIASRGGISAPRQIGMEV
jgi:adenine-specific DNA methylase